MLREGPYIGSLDIILSQLGDMGAFNIRNFAFLLFPIYFAGMHGHSFVFEALDIDYRCKVKECEGTGSSAKWKPFALPPSDNHAGYARCARYAAKSVLIAGQSTCNASLFTTKIIPCTEFVYNEKTAVRDFNLGCKDSTKALLAACHNVGVFISLPLAGFVADKYGRKMALSLTSLMAFIFGIMRSFSVNFYMLLLLEFVEAGLGTGAYSTAFFFAMEIVGPDRRIFCGTIINSVYILGSASLGILAWMLKDWRLLLRFVYAPAVLVFSYIWILDESVRWLLTKGRNGEAVAILEKAAKMNNKTITLDVLFPEPAKSESSEKSLDQLSNNSQMSEEKSPEKPQKSSARQVYESSTYSKTMASCSILWFTCTFIYYSLTLNSVYIAGNKYINYIMVAFIEIPAYFACLAVLDQYGRKKVITYAFFVGAVAFVALSFIPKGHSWIFLSIYLSAKFFLTVAYTSTYLFVSEVVPDHLRQFLLTVCSTLGRLGSVLAPITPLLAVYYYNLPAILFGTLAGTAVFALTVTMNTIYADQDLANYDYAKYGVHGIPSTKRVCCARLFYCQFEAAFLR